MKFGRFTLSLHNFGFFRLDGGSMFGSVPKNLWGKKIPVDDENCIPLALRSLLIRTEERTFLVDTGIGDKWNDKQRAIFGIRSTPATELGFDPETVTDIILTHLHFDHAGGIARWKPGTTELELTWPGARVHLQEANLANARAPNVKERASYLPENVRPLEQAELNLLPGSAEIEPDLFVHRVDGHTVGQQIVELRHGNESILFLTDLVPTSRHLPVPFHMGYDICASTLLTEKEAILARAERENAVVIFQHDPDLPAARIRRDERGHFTPEILSVPILSS